jgi:hypothetical protein
MGWVRVLKPDKSKTKTSGMDDTRYSHDAHTAAAKAW